ncbi:hypothetical protein MNBD_GAMMA12-480 [hydrothermal vent metagenome]|uniref:Lipoprotein n=1 Tax=hydrothermal vent metagenome TaxID=652676 RepID=A0A3B0ZF66_9ZZZZ
MHNIFKFLLLVCAGNIVVACDSTPKTPTIPDGPAASINAVFKGLADNRPDFVWIAMPKSYQNDVNQLVGKWASLTEEDIYNSYMSLVKRFSIAVKQKRGMILNTIMKMAPPGKRKQLGPMVDAFITMLNEITNSQIMHHKKMVNANVGKFISLHGSTLMKSFMKINTRAKTGIDRLTSTKIVQVSVTGDEAKLDIVKNGKPSGRPKVFVKIEGRWVPSDIQRHWNKQIARVNRRLDKAKASATSNNDKLRKTLPMLESFVKSFEDVKNEAQLASFPMRVMLLGQQLKSLVR